MYQPRWLNDGHKFRQEIVGESNYQNNLKWAERTYGKYVIANIYLENENKFDKNAVKIRINNQTIGYLPREDAIAFREKLGIYNFSGAVFQSTIEITGGGKTSNGEDLMFGAMLDIALHNT